MRVVGFDSATGIERAMVLADELLVAMIDVERAQPIDLQGARERWRGQSVELRARDGRAFAVAARALEAEEVLRRADEPFTSVVCPPHELGGDWAERFDASARIRLQTFLAGLMRGQVARDDELAAQLSELRDLLRDPLPTATGPGDGLAARLDSVTALDGSGFWLIGSVVCGPAAGVRLTAVSPEGARSVVPHTAVIDHGDGGFLAYVVLDAPSRHPDGWVMEFRHGAEAIEARCPRPVITSGDAALAQVGAVLDPWPDDTILKQVALPSLERLRDAESTVEVLDFGTVADAPDLSAVVAISDPDEIEHHLAQRAREAAGTEIELIFVASEASSGAPIAELATELHELYGTPFRLARLSPPARRARALNLTAAVARGRLLVLLSGGALPAHPGGLGCMRALYDSSPSIGAVVPKLLHVDGSIAHAGTAYVRDRWSGASTRERSFVGMNSTFPAASSPRRVDGGSDACLLIAASHFELMGGFAELYLGDDVEADDLCLRLAQEGLETWYCPDAEFHLISVPAPSGPHDTAERFDGWLFERRRHEPFADASVTEEWTGPAPPAAAVGPVIPGCGSARDGDPIEELRVTPAPVAGPVLDSLVVIADGDGQEWEPLYRGTYSFAIAGWALARAGEPLTIEVRGTGGEPPRMVASLPSRQAAGKHPGVTGADAAGFQFVLGSLALPTEFTLDVVAVDAAGTSAPLARVDGRRRALQSAYRPAIQPLLITMLGRSGSNWLITLLGSHPAVLALRPFHYEAMLASYWASVLLTLSSPASYMQALQPELYELDWWTGNGRHSPLPLRKPTVALPQWLGSDNVEVLAGFCQSRLESFYTELARSMARDMPAYFVEKCPPGIGRTIGELYPNGREIVLVRDFRDRACSIDDYNAKRGLRLWGQDRARDDAEWFGLMRAEALALQADWRERHDRTHLVRYEDLIRDPDGTLEGILRYLELDPGPTTIAGMLERARQTLPHAQEDHRTAASTEASVGRWRDDLSPERQAASVVAFDDVLTAFGYEATREGDARTGG